MTKKPQGILALLVIVVLLGGAIFAVIKKFAPQYQTVSIAASSEKTNFLNDQEVQKRLLDLGYKLELKDTPDEDTDLFWPATSADKNKFKSPIKTYFEASYKSNLVLVMSNPVYNALLKSKHIVQSGNRCFVKNTPSFVFDALSGTLFKGSGLKGTSRIETPQPNTSNAGTLALYWIYFELGKEQDLTQQTLQDFGGLVTENYKRFSKYQNSAELIDGFLSNPGNRMIFTHESLIIERLVSGGKGDYHIVYSNPTMTITHPIMSRDKKFDALVSALCNDAQIQHIAWTKYGLLPSRPKGEFSTNKELSIYGIAPNLTETLETPGQEVLASVRASYVAPQGL